MIGLSGLQEFQTFIRAISKAISSIIVLGRSQPEAEAHLSCLFGLEILSTFQGIELAAQHINVKMVNIQRKLPVNYCGTAHRSREAGCFSVEP